MNRKLKLIRRNKQKEKQRKALMFRLSTQKASFEKNEKHHIELPCPTEFHK